MQCMAELTRVVYVAKHSAVEGINFTLTVEYFD